MPATNTVAIHWPSGECKPVLATPKLPKDLVKQLDANIFRSKDDLDWFEVAAIEVARFGSVLVMRHDNNPKGLTAVYVDCAYDTTDAEKQLIHFFELSDSDVAWRASS